MSVGLDARVDTYGIIKYCRFLCFTFKYVCIYSVSSGWYTKIKVIADKCSVVYIMYRLKIEAGEE